MWTNLVDDRPFVDSGFVVALVGTRDERHAEAETLSFLHEGAKLVTTDAVLLEVGNTLARYDKLAAAAVLRTMLDSPETEVVRLDADLLEQALDLDESTPDQTWGLVDCVSFVVMRCRGITRALTFDRHFAQAGFLPLTAGDRRP